LPGDRVPGTKYRAIPVEYQALYRKYRPQSFDDVIGQSHVTTTLAREIADGRVAHAYLFTGPRGTGKTTTARILAKALNCTNRGPQGAPCNECVSCVSITEGTSLDVLELDAASHNSIDDIRDIRLSVTTVASTATSKRVFVLDEAHMLSKAAGNALLKTLEEPPEHVHFVLATTEPYKLLDTIRSRSQRFDFHPVPIEDLAGHLSLIAEREGYQFDAGALLSIARHAGGSVRDSLSLLEQVAALGAGTVEVGGVRRALGLADSEAFMRLVEAVAAQDAKGALELVAELSADGVDLRRFVAESVAFFRGAFLAHYAPNLAEIADEPPEVYGAWRRAAELVTSGDVLRAVDLLGEALIRLREGREERLMTELALIKLTRPETASDTAALLSRIERLERGQPRQTVVESPMAAAEKTAPVAAADEGEVVVDTPPDAPTPTGNGSEVSFEQLQKVWPGLFGSLRDVLGARRWAFFREAVPVSVEGDTITLEVAHDFHLQSLQEDDVVASIVATRAGDLLGSEVKIRFRSRQGSEAEIETEEIDLGDLEERSERSTDPTSLLVDELGAEEVEE
jgi:DNA polymerase III subunit gamma/tau